MIRTKLLPLSERNYNNVWVDALAETIDAHKKCHRAPDDT